MIFANVFIRYNLPSVIWASVILILSFMPGRDLPEVSLFQFDKLIHFLFYIMLMLFTCYGWRKQNTYPTLQTVSTLSIATLCIMFGILIEIGQHTLTVDRFFDLGDIIANTLGVAAGTWAVSTCKFRNMAG